MARIERTVFISYRRTNLPWALCIYQNLTMHGYDVFFDYQSIDSGSFETAILDNIRARAHFVLILTPSALERCKNPNDWLRREIETAIDEKRNIVPLMLEGFDFGSPLVQETLTGKLSLISSINALPVHGAYVFEALDRLRERFLNVALEDINLPTLQAEAQEITKAEQTVANEAEPVTEEQLTAQTWFERGYVFQEDKNLEEALRCYSEAIRLDSSLYYAQNNLGVLLDDLKRYEEAETAYRKAIELNPSDATAYYNLGNLLKHENLKRYEEAETAYRKAIELNPSYATAYYNLGVLLDDLKRYEEAETAYRKAIELNPSDATAYNNLGNLLKHENLKRYEEAETAYRKAIELNPSLDIAHLNLAQLNFDQGNWQEAIKVLTQAIKFIPESARCYRQRGLVYQTVDNLELALNDYKQAISLQSDYGIVRMSLFGLLKKMGRNDEAKEHEPLAREFAKTESEYNQACFESLCENIEEGINLLKIAFEKGQSSKDWAKQDPDLENLRNDPRFQKLVDK